MATILNDFPEGRRGTYHIYEGGDPNNSLAERIAFAKKLINERAKVTGLILARVVPRGNHWVIFWWPANEPRHEIYDEFLTGDDSVRTFSRTS